MIETPDIPGAVDVVAWFGYWPSFHDAEVVSITLDRLNASRVVIHTFTATREIDARGYYVLRNHTLTTIRFHDVLNLEIKGFSNQNVIFGLSIESQELS